MMEQGNTEQGNTEQGNTEQGNTEQTQAEQGDRDQTETARIAAGQSDPVETAGQDRVPTPGDLLRSLPVEAETRGTRYVSAQAMQARLFSVYDAAAAAEEALAMVQQQLTLTLNRSYYEADEIKSLAARLDSLLALDSVDLSDALDLNEGDLVSEE